MPGVEIIETFEVDEIWGKLYSVPDGFVVPQHQHEHDHVTMLISGRMHVWIEEKYQWAIHSPKAFKVEAHKRHTFRAIGPCVFCCLHNLRGTGLAEPSVELEHSIGDIKLE